MLEHDVKLRDNYYRIKEDLDRTLMVNPLYSCEESELIQKIYSLQDEKKFLISALRTVQQELDKEKKYGDIFASICERVPSDKIDEFSVKLNRLLNGIS
jgi:DNA-binding MarR family transcriptional regulator